MHKSTIKSKAGKKENIRREFADRYGQITEIDLYIEGKYLTFLLKSKGVAAFKESENGGIPFPRQRQIQSDYL